jgi:hypothetical protein
VDGWTP